MAFETRKASPALCMKMNGIATGNVARKTQQKHGQRAQPVSPAQARALGRLGQIFEALAHAFEFRRLKNGRNERRQGIGDEPLGLYWIGGLAHRTQGEEAAVLLRQAAHQIQDAINDPPSHIASERTDEHRANFRHDPLWRR